MTRHLAHFLKVLQMDPIALFPRPRRGPGRRALPQGRVRRHTLTVHLNSQELSLASVAAGLNDSMTPALARRRLSEFVRSLLSKTAATVPAPLNIAAWSELARVCANLNQLSRSANSGRVVGVTSQDLDDVRSKIEQLRNLLIGI